MKIKSILIVGGGSSGWMTASFMSKFFAEDDIKISLVESDSVPTVGVGESTIGSINNYFQLLGLEDEEWMPYCNGTYKNSIRFTDFKEIGHEIEYPFGGNYNLPDSIMTWGKVAAIVDDLDHHSFTEFHNENTYLARFNRCTKNEKGYIDGFNFRHETAYHFNAGQLGQFLKEKICIPSGVEHHYDDIVGTEKDEDGYVTSVVGKSGKYSADLYVDCTGFKSVLLEQEMGSKFLSYKPWLSNDSALATHIPYVDKETEIRNETNCTAIENGWVWNIPLWNEIGTGYVYSSDFVDDETAEKEFRKHLARDPRFEKRAKEAEVRKINIRHGIRENGWVKNVVGVGLSYAFVEPLESTSLISTHSIVLRLCDIIKDRNFNCNQYDIDCHNYASRNELDGFRDFVAMHYAMGTREDTPYWKFQTRRKLVGLAHEVEDFKNIYDVSVNNMVAFKDSFEACVFGNMMNKRWTIQTTGWNYIQAGFGYKPLTKHFMKILIEDHPEVLEEVQETFNQWIKHREEVIEYVKTLPSHHEFLKEHIYKNGN